MLSPKKRFEVLKRDNFRCQYCGRNGKDVTLEVDHITPKAKWWTDSMENLITCCRECNMWKWDTEIFDISTVKMKEKDVADKILMEFFKERNHRMLWTIDKNTIVLLTWIVRWKVAQNYPRKVECELYERNIWRKECTIEIQEIAFNKYNEWWKRTDEVLQHQYDDVEWEMLWYIDDITDEEAREWPKDYSWRLNYKISEYNYDDDDLKRLVKKYTLFHNKIKEWTHSHNDMA